MQTSLPDLPFPYTGIELPDEPKSFACAASQTFPRTDLRTLSPWITFTNEIGEAIRTAMNLNKFPEGHQLKVGNSLSVKSPVSNEEALRGHAALELHAAVTGTVKALGVQGRFVFPLSGNVAIVGDPDFAWVQDKDRPHPKIIVCASTLLE